MLTGDREGFLTIWRLSTLEWINEIKLYNNSINYLSLENGNNYLLAINEDDNLIIYNYMTNKVIEKNGNTGIIWA